jgi:hypothetical protein
MNRRSSTSHVVPLIVVAASAIAIAGQTPASAPKNAGSPTKKTWMPLRTPSGQPDLQGIWNFGTVTPLERPAAYADKEFLSPAEAAEFERQAVQRNNVDEREGTAGTTSDVDRAYNEVWWDRGTKVIGTLRTSMIVEPRNGKMPPRTPEGQKRFQTYGGFTGRGGFDSWEDRSLWERCITNNAMPRLQTGYNMNVQIFQTPQYVALQYEMIHEVRIIPIDNREHLKPTVRQILGDSRGHWEGDTLVVDVTNFTSKTNFNGSAEGLHLIERFRRLDADTLLYEFTIDDPTTFTQTWKGELPMRKTKGPLYEYACHEGNYGLPGILAGARAKENAEAATKR